MHVFYHNFITAYQNATRVGVPCCRFVFEYPQKISSSLGKKCIHIWVIGWWSDVVVFGHELDFVLYGLSLEDTIKYLTNRWHDMEDHSPIWNCSKSMAKYFFISWYNVPRGILWAIGKIPSVLIITKSIDTKDYIFPN
jgi:hypothetical protein